MRDKKAEEAGRAVTFRTIWRRTSALFGVLRRCCLVETASAQGTQSEDTSGRLRNVLRASELGDCYARGLLTDVRLLVKATTEAANYVIIYEANRLHERVANLWAHESKAASH